MMGMDDGSVLEATKNLGGEAYSSATILISLHFLPPQKTKARDAFYISMLSPHEATDYEGCNKIEVSTI
jgi:hypothetical protein